MSEKKQAVEHQSCGLHDDLIIQEILTRLPVRSLVRFMSVSKQWYSTLSSSKFASSHLMKSPLSHPSAPLNTLFIYSAGNNYYLFSCDDDQVSGNFKDNLVKLDDHKVSGSFKDNLVKLDVQFGCVEDCLEHTGCCNGLLCLTPGSGEYFLLWNPATRKMQRYETDVYIKGIPKEVKRSLFCGFSYVSSVDDYKFVQFVKPSVETGVTNLIGFIFSLRENKWTRSDFDFGDAVSITGYVVLTNERLYWPAFLKSTDIILSFDLGVERFEVIKLDDFEILGIMGGCLSKCNPNVARTGDRFLHIFEAPGVIGKSIEFPKELKLGRFSQMIGFTRTGKLFVTGVSTREESDYFSRMLGVVDTSTEPMQYTRILKFRCMTRIARYVPSLVSPSPAKELMA